MVKNIAIIGGSLSGVSCAYFLDKLSGVNSRKFNIDIIEKNLEFVRNKFGKFQYGQEIYDNGWHNSINDQSVLFYLMLELGLHRYLMETTSTKKVFYTEKGIKYLPEKMFYGYPLDKRELLLSDLFDFKEKLSLLSNMHKKFKVEDIQALTVKQFFISTLNDNIYDKIVEPLLTSYYGSEVSEQNFSSLMPELAMLTLQNDEIDNVIEDVYNKKTIDNTVGSKQYRLKFTLRSFVESLESNFSDDVFIEFNRKVEKIEKRGTKYLVHSNGSMYYYDYVILAINHKQFLPWFSDDKTISEFFDKVSYVSNIVVTLVYRKENLHINREIGELIFSQSKDSYITKLEYVSNKWLDVKTNDIQIVRAYINRQDKVKELLELSDDDVAKVIEDEIKDVHSDMKKAEKIYVSKLIDNYRYCDKNYNENLGDFSEYVSKKYPNLYFIGNSKKSINFESTILEAKETAKKIIESIK